MGLELLADVAKLAIFIAIGYLSLQASVRRWRPAWSSRLARRRVAVLGLLTLATGAIKLIEDVVAKESGPADAAALGFVREQVPAALHGFFAGLTLTGSAAFLLPVSVVAVLALLLAGRHFEARLLGASMLAAPLLVYVLKAMVGRERPLLWEAQSYWGSSFPSGHTLGAAAFAAAAALCLARIWPRSAPTAMTCGMLWASGVALSRLVLGVHWPSDVLAALCLGLFIPLGLSMAFDRGRPEQR